MPSEPVSSRGVMKVVLSYPAGLRRWGSVLLSGRGGDVLGGEHGEDVGLQDLHEELEAEDRHAEDEGEHAGDLVDDRLAVQQQVLPTEHEDQDQQVAGE